MPHFSVLMISIGYENSLLTSKEESYRDREAPHGAPLPHHRAYGSVHGGSAGQASDFQGNESSSLVPESIP